jgi:hypothetical protein
MPLVVRDTTASSNHIKVGGSTTADSYDPRAECLGSIVCSCISLVLAVTAHDNAR